MNRVEDTMLTGARKRLQTALIMGLALAVVCGFAARPVQAATNQVLWQSAGVTYYCDTNPRIPLAVHVVKIDRSQKDLELHTTLGGNNQIGMAVLSEQVKFINPQVGRAVAAINGDYFFIERPFAGDPRNLQILCGGELVSGPGEDRAFFYQDAKGEPHITNALQAFTVTWPNGKTSPIGLNQDPETGQAVLFTTAVGSSSRVEGVDLILEHSGKGTWLPLRIGQKLSAKVRQVNHKGYSKITRDTMVLSLSPKMLKQLPPMTPGMEIEISTATTPNLSGALLAIGGGPSLVRAGKAREPKEYSGYQMREPRTAMGWNDKYYFFVQTDGRQPRYSMGMSLLELANYFVKLNCDYAINLDGGGSCTTWVNGRIVNNPSQRGGERPSANALVLVRKTLPTH